MKVLVLGIGQSFRSDDAAGLEAVREWQEKYPKTAANVMVQLSETAGVELLELFEGIEAAFIVDAVQKTGRAGEVFILRKDAVNHKNHNPASVHGWGINETLKLGILLIPELNNCYVVIIGISGENFKFGIGLSCYVHTGVQDAVEQLEVEIQKYLNIKSLGDQVFVFP